MAGATAASSTGRLNRSIPFQAVALLLLSSIVSPRLFAEHEFSGVLDVRAASTDSSSNYLEGGYGKLRYADGERLSLAQLGLKYQYNWSHWSARVIGNVYADGETRRAGVTEAFVSYRGTPNPKGIRYRFRTGIMYPSISMENVATAWNSPHSLSWSTQNTWIGEEVRHLGIEGSVDFTGKARDSDHQLSITGSLFQFNDPMGSMLAWHGWTQSSRQSFWGEKLVLPPLPTLAPGEMLELQAPYSDVFKELDHDWGFHLAADWQWRRSLRLKLGYYYNVTADDVLEDGQYTWQSEFVHLGADWRPAPGWQVLAQHMNGDSRMRVQNNMDVVGIDFDNTFVRLSYQKAKHRFALRLEDFGVDDYDGLPGDNNDEQGEAYTLTYQYQLRRRVYLGVEYTAIDSRRPSRLYVAGGAKDLDESQLQVAVRYFFAN